MVCVDMHCAQQHEECMLACRGSDGQLLPQRVDYKEFRGSSSYASVNAHLLQDLGERAQLYISSRTDGLGRIRSVAAHGGCRAP